MPLLEETPCDYFREKKDRRVCLIIICQGNKLVRTGCTASELGCSATDDLWLGSCTGEQSSLVINIFIILKGSQGAHCVLTQRNVSPDTIFLYPPSLLVVPILKEDTKSINMLLYYIKMQRDSLFPFMLLIHLEIKQV